MEDYDWGDFQKTVRDRMETLEEKDGFALDLHKVALELLVNLVLEQGREIDKLREEIRETRRGG